MGKIKAAGRAGGFLSCQRIGARDVFARADFVQFKTLYVARPER